MAVKCQVSSPQGERTVNAWTEPRAPSNPAGCTLWARPFQELAVQIRRLQQHFSIVPSCWEPRWREIRVSGTRHHHSATTSTGQPPHAHPFLWCRPAGVASGVCSIPRHGKSSRPTSCVMQHFLLCPPRAGLLPVTLHSRQDAGRTQDKTQTGETRLAGVTSEHSEHTAKKKMHNPVTVTPPAVASQP